MLPDKYEGFFSKQNSLILVVNSDFRFSHIFSLDINELDFKTSNLLSVKAYSFNL